MLGRLPAERGVSLVELMVGIAVLAVLMVVGVPSFSTWLQNSQIKVSADSIQNGLQMARGEAIRRNTSVRFQLTDTADNACAISTTGANWVVSLDDPSSLCATPASDTVPPRVVQMRASADGTPNAVVAASQAAIVFTGLGRINPVPAANITIDVSNPTIAGGCATPTANAAMHCLRVEVSTGGQVRMCDQRFTAATNPQGC